MKKKRESEADVAARLVAWLDHEGWEVYQEVSFQWSRVIDIVAVKKDERLAWAIEVKTSANKHLLYQATQCRRWTTIVSVAVPKPKRFTQARKDYIAKAAERGIGFIHIGDNGDIEIVEGVRSPNAKWGRGEPSKYSEFFELPDDYKTYCAAGSTGGFLTPFKLTCMNLRDYVKENPGCTVSEAIANISHHYSSDASARSALAKWDIEGLEVKRCFFLKDETND